LTLRTWSVIRSQSLAQPTVRLRQLTRMAIVLKPER